MGARGWSEDIKPPEPGWGRVEGRLSDAMLPPAQVLVATVAAEVKAVKQCGRMDGVADYGPRDEGGGTDGLGFPHCPALASTPEQRRQLG
jgi:hypothetical protein